MIKTEKIILIVCLLCALAVTSCRKDFGARATAVSVKVNTSFAAHLPLTTFPENAEIKLTNTKDGRIWYAKTQKEGSAVYENLIPGTYEVQASLKMSAAEYRAITGITIEEDTIFFNGNLPNQNITKKHQELSLTLTSGKTGKWLIKQVYFGGSDQWDGANFRDQFIEFYNNTDSVLYADGLYFAQIFGENNAKPKLSDPWYLPSGQLNWSIPTGMADANTQYIYAYNLYRIPGTGKQYPVNPGESVVIAQNALNHSAPYIDNSGTLQTVNNPDLTIDLSTADFEAYLYDYYRNIDPTATPYRSDVDNINVPNIEVLLSTHNDMILDNLGRDAFAIFEASEEYVKNLINLHSYPSPKATQTSTKNKFIQIPIAIVIDGVELAQTISANRAPKRMPPEIDAGFTFLPKGYYRSQSVIRKTNKTVNGRRVLTDSNNSSNDFEAIDRPLPRGFNK